jgi:hypothetical protein
MYEPDGRRPGRVLNKLPRKTCIAPNVPCLRRSPRPTGPRAMWVRRALQRAEPQAPQGYKGRRAGRMLGAVRIFRLWKYISTLNARRAKRGDVHIIIYLLYFVHFLINLFCNSSIELIMSFCSSK